MTGRSWMHTETLEQKVFCGGCDERVTLPDTWTLEG